MTDVRTVALVSALVFSAVPLTGQELSRYRDHALGSSLVSVVHAVGGRETDVRTLHTRPARIQRFEWRTPYMRPAGPEEAVQDLVFSFYDDRLYRVVVTYDRKRMEGLTNTDVVEGVSAVYGPPTSPEQPGADVPALLELSSDVRILARWEDSSSLVALTRSDSAPLFQLILVSKTLAGPAAAVITEALRLDAKEAPERERERRAREAAAAAAAAAKARAVNRGTFRP